MLFWCPCHDKKLLEKVCSARIRHTLNWDKAIVVKEHIECDIVMLMKIGNTCERKANMSKGMDGLAKCLTRVWINNKIKESALECFKLLPIRSFLVPAAYVKYMGMHVKLFFCCDTFILTALEFESSNKPNPHMLTSLASALAYSIVIDEFLASGVYSIPPMQGCKDSSHMRSEQWGPSFRLVFVFTKSRPVRGNSQAVCYGGKDAKAPNIQSDKQIIWTCANVRILKEKMTSVFRLTKFIGRHRVSGMQYRSLSIMSMKPCDFVKYMKRNKLHRCFIVHDETSMQPISSNDETTFNELTEFCLNDKHDYRNHEGLFLEIGKRSSALLGAFVWRTNRGQACGGIRLWEYETMEDYIRDGLRLSYGMGVKSALAGLWAGGGKGAEDAGVAVSDLDAVNERTRFITCISECKGGSGNPSIATGKGIVCAMEATLDFFGHGNIEGRRIVSQGSGNVARVIIDSLLDKNVDHIHASDCNEQQLELTEKMFAEKNLGRLHLEHVPKGETVTLEIPCDILSPNALGNVLNEKTIPLIKSNIICGAANNQLGKTSDNELLADRGITYIVDFLCNRMGIVNCANEGYGRLKHDPAMFQHFSKDWKDSIWNTTQDVLKNVQEKGITPVNAATEIAERKSLELHPIWPKRCKQIIQDLVQSKWAEEKRH
ncbi:uncharacterized protein LOC130636983 [Hydractinia symbiolongicarpus]|uniref:uncharacterized protein LOC130636983 n=1 Tax=Hydractinia symbiolongicarpus TaxID=13093 RepID=UPI00254E9993|nr:uncharacterized protein LOC130636983 [Hydractinia symbiolongicarpus]